ncbi:signal transduction histidine kinase [Paraburkholderia bannensis]|uniref:histidine kinase n=1 Tax=Paraburkholderia bannensis TaxID=765414 RepID=A0A7W9U492_9BURK|nr:MULTISPECIES: ATP-binding protein [Paraburkholderia]MBB3261758.1 signal transduction histidine kinase [Paraburkholderia sp. WP4_3_2]MBB6106742.1 signal transduction histidine kinase [Paraburkholderia bannensis]
MKSLRRRLLWWLLPATLLTGLLASAATYRGALTELDELLNDQLKAVAQHVLVEPDGHLSLQGMQGANEDRLSGEQSHAVLLQVWRGETPVFNTDLDSALPPPTGTGFADVIVKGQLWHTYVTRDGDTFVRVAQARRARWEAVAEIAMHLLWPVLSLVPLLALFLWFGIGYGLRPLRDIAANLKRRDVDNMQTIDTTAIPGEVKPLVDSLNDLLLRLDNAFTAQRHFIADAAHELRTPIMGLALQTDLLPTAPNEEERDLITAQIRTGTARLAHLAEQLLTLARLGPDSTPPAMSDLDLTSLARSVVGERARLAQANEIDLGLVAGSAVHVRGNEDALRILLNNLVDNAIRYAGPHTRVDVVTRREDAAPVLMVCDTGPGIAAEDRERVWERFYRGAGHAATGSGLGLSIVRRIAEQHQAAFALDSGLDGRGLTVRLRFPRLVPAIGPITSNADRPGAHAATARRPA